MSNAMDLLLRVGCTWLLAYAIVHTHGPFNLFERLRKLDPSGLTACILCTATWIGVIVMLAPDGVLLQGFGVAGLAMFLHSYTGWKSYG